MFKMDTDALFFFFFFFYFILRMLQSRVAKRLQEQRCREREKSYGECNCESEGDLDHVGVPEASGQVCDTRRRRIICWLL